MSKLDYIADLESRLNEIDANIERARAALEKGSIEDKRKALAEVAGLRQRHDDLNRRIKAAKEHGAETWSDLHTSFQEEVDALVETLDRWLTRLD